MSVVSRRIASAAGRPDSMLIASNLVGLCFGLVSAALQARALGPVGRGDIAIALVPGTLIGMLMCFGLPDYFGRRAAQGAAVRPLAGTAAGLALAAGAVVAIPYFWFIESHTLSGSPSRWLLILYAAVSPVLVYGYCATSIAAGIDRWRAVAISRFLPQLVTVIGLLVLVRLGPDVRSVGLLLVATTVLGSLYPGLSSGVFPGWAPNVHDVRPALRFGARGWPAGSTALLNQRIDLLLLTMIATSYELGLYAVATTLAAVLNAIANSIALPVRNRIVRGQRSIVPGVTAVTSALVLVVAAIVAASLPILIPLVLGREFVPGQTVMIVLLLAQVPLASIVVLTQSLIAVGRPGSPLFGEVAALVSTVALVLVLYPRFGIAGAAIANLAGNVISLTVLVGLAKRHIVTARSWRFFIPTRASIDDLRRGGPHGAS